MIGKIKKVLIILMAVCSGMYATAQDLRSDSVDILHTDISLDFSAFLSRVLYGKTVISFTPKINNSNSLRLDLLQLQVDSVKINNTTATYTYNDSVIAISTAPLQMGVVYTATVFYHGTPLQPAGDFGGFYWNATYAYNIGVSFLADPHNFGKVWYPCFDNFVERSSHSFHITTDTVREAFCNGVLDSVSLLSGKKIWHWHLDQTIPSYLTMVAVSDYAVINDNTVAQNGNLPIVLAVNKNDSLRLLQSFIHLKDAIQAFEYYFGPYEFPKVGYCIVPFNAGAMEHATAISYMQGAVDGSTANETLMAHELSHHWFGDLVTCDRAGEMWLNEGWARYCEWLFLEYLYGKDAAIADYKTVLEDVLHFAHVNDGGYYAVSGVPTALTYSNRHVYGKGAMVAHTLRAYLGDALFFSCIKNYLQHYKFSDVNSIKFRDYLEQCSGKDLHDFFDDWVFDKGFTNFTIQDKKVIQLGVGNYEVSVQIKQRLNHATAFYTNVPIEVFYFDSTGNSESRIATVSGNCTDFTAFLDFAPAFITLDFDEKLADATTQTVKKMKASGTQDMGIAKVIIYPLAGSDSSMVLAQHHWVAPDNAKVANPLWHLSDYRYWQLDGNWAADFKANARFNYNGSGNTTFGYLDNSFITNREDSIVMLYRPNAQSDWQLADSFKVFPLTGINDKIGYVYVYGIKKGEYSMAIYDAARATDTAHYTACYPLSIEEVDKEEVPFDVFPNPVNTQEITVTCNKTNYFTKAKLINMFGEVVMERELNSEKDYFTIALNGLFRGQYVLTLFNKHGKPYSKKIVKTN